MFLVTAIEENNEYLCRYTDEDHCQFTYVYYYDIERKLHIRAQQERTCPPEVKLTLATFQLTGSRSCAAYRFIIFKLIFDTCLPG